MAVNSIFHTSNAAALATEQNLYRDLVIESIQIYGHDVHYLDRTLVNEDTIMGTDSLAKFTTQAKIEMYMEDSEGGFAGEKELIKLIKTTKLVSQFKPYSTNLLAVFKKKENNFFYSFN